MTGLRELVERGVAREGKRILVRLNAAGPRVYRIGSSTLQALERRGFVSSKPVASASPSKEYSITATGIALLKALEGERDG